MNFQSIYNNLIKKRKVLPASLDSNISADTAFEQHHIIPRSFGGLNNDDNLVELTLREHYIAHLLLYKIELANGNIDRADKMACALWFFINKKSKSVIKAGNSYVYEKIRLAFIKAQRNKIMITDGKTIKKISKSSPIPPGWTRYYSLKNKIAVNKNNGQIVKFINASDEFSMAGWNRGSGRKTSGSSNMHWITNGTESKFILANAPIPEGWRVGRCFAQHNKGLVAINNGIINKYVKINSSDDIPPGWQLGAMPTNNHAMIGRIWITNGEINKSIKPDQLIPEGWRRGRCGVEKNKTGKHAQFHGEMLSYTEIAKRCHIDKPTFLKLLESGMSIEDIEQRQLNKQKTYMYNGQKYRFTPLLKKLKMHTGGKIRERMQKLLDAGVDPDSAKRKIHQDESARKSKQFKNSVFITNGIITRRISQNENIPEGFYLKRNQ